MKMKKFLSVALLVPGLVLLSGCDWFGGEKSNDQKEKPAQEYKTGSVKVSKEVVATIDGQPKVTADDFQRAFDAAKKQQPMIEQMIPFLPEDQQRMLYSQLLEQFVNRILVRDYVAEQGWDKSADYQANASQAHEDLDYDLANIEFQNRLLKDVQVSDADAQRYYKANKATNRIFQQAPFMSDMGGVQSLAVKVKDKAQANTLAAAAKKSDLKKAAAEAGQKVENLGVVNAQSTEPDRMVVMKLLSMKSFPAVDVVESGGSFWVVQGVSKVESQFAPFEDVKDSVKEVVMSEGFQKRYLEELGKFKGKHKVDVNQEFIEARIIKKEVPAMPAEPAKK